MVNSDITYWVTVLKSWIACWVNKECALNTYGDGQDECCWLKFAFANELVVIMQCYQENTTSNNTTAVDPCLTDDSMRLLFQSASNVINS